MLLGVAALLVACALAYATDNVLRPAGGFTQAWITNGSEGAPLDLGVENDEGQAETYRVELLMDGRQVREWRDVRLESGRRWSAELTVADAPRPEQAELKVYRAEVPDTVYRDVRTPLRTGR